MINTASNDTFDCHCSQEMRRIKCRKQWDHDQDEINKANVNEMSNDLSAGLMIRSLLTGTGRTTAHLCVFDLPYQSLARSSNRVAVAARIESIELPPTRPPMRRIVQFDNSSHSFLN
jgi:hypothetical protein